jgi:DNA polymerase (family 10)
MTNTAIAQKLRTHAHELARRKENLYRVRAFRRAAEAVLRLDEPVEALVARGGPAALAAVPGIGPSLATTILGYASFGVWVTRTIPTVAGV